MHMLANILLASGARQLVRSLTPGGADATSHTLRHVTDILQSATSIRYG
jgi:hypothetical protein